MKYPFRAKSVFIYNRYDIILTMKNELNEFLGKDRRQFELNNLLENNTPDNPFILFDAWLQDAILQKFDEPYAMVLSTCHNNQPSQRVVYLREVTSEKLVFFTNYLSRKGHEIDKNPSASLLFFWAKAERQIRLEGTIQKASKEVSDNYFKSRPRNSQLGAWASEQSKVIDNREELDERMKMFNEKFKDMDVTRPEHWGGYMFEANYLEFWQGRSSRLHDRICYKKENNGWTKSRLAP